MQDTDCSRLDGLTHDAAVHRLDAHRPPAPVEEPPPDGEPPIEKPPGKEDTPVTPPPGEEGPAQVPPPGEKEPEIRPPPGRRDTRPLAGGAAPFTRA